MVTLQLAVYMCQIQRTHALEAMLHNMLPLQIYFQQTTLDHAESMQLKFELYWPVVLFVFN